MAKSDNSFSTPAMTKSYHTVSSRESHKQEEANNDPSLIPKQKLIRCRRSNSKLSKKPKYVSTLTTLSPWEESERQQRKPLFF